MAVLMMKPFLIVTTMLLAMMSKGHVYDKCMIMVMALAMRTVMTIC